MRETELSRGYNNIPDHRGSTSWNSQSKRRDIKIFSWQDNVLIRVLYDNV